ncbi:pimeloyl-ACP methyl ester carboxylesterase [Crossiella equi]|uniref:Pimeloyl-ACP methyl ester carboxylesterase n=1 Tax=Crossiella equi TaxID=130796 RepID=A0ABS5A625_9PSEU|nr:alpha/beta hydrolase [Crossiella equi]MBP2472054.1 pimeloyl-ACP methyl ester carboxylesterase [Crossiella equi]
MTPENLTLHIGAHSHTALATGPADGQLVLFLHGWPEFADCWQHHLAVLGRAGYRAVAVDQRGYATGARPSDPADYAVPTLVRDALGFADALGAQRFHLVAHDWGGMVAWSLAGHHPERLSSLSVLATPHPEALHAEQRRDEQQDRRLDYVRFFRQRDGAPEASLLAEDGARIRLAYGGKLPEHLVANNIRRLQEPGALSATLNWYRAMGEDLHVRAPRITTPTLYAWGALDAALGRGAAERTREFVDAEYEFVEYADGSHWLPEERPAETAELVLRHVDKHNGR